MLKILYEILKVLYEILKILYEILKVLYEIRDELDLAPQWWVRRRFFDQKLRFLRFQKARA